MKIDLNHLNHSVGKFMVEKVPVAFVSATIADIEKLLFEKIAEFETINYIYIVDKEKILRGVVSIKEIFRSPKMTLVTKVMSDSIVSVRRHTDQERAAFLALKHNLKAVPVTDKDGHFLGVVTSDTILRILDSEAVENILRFGGIMHTANFDDVFHLSIFKSLKHRLPWLLFGLVGGLLASRLVSVFEVTLSRNLILAAFLPLIVYMAAAVGTQLEAFIIRDLAVNPQLKFTKYFLHQLAVVFIVGLIISALLYGGGLLFYGNHQISFVIALALFFAIISSVVTGLVIPFLFGKLRLDPANASGPTATIIQDIVSIFVYFSIASALL